MTRTELHLSRQLDTARAEIRMLRENQSIMRAAIKEQSFWLRNLFEQLVAAGVLRERAVPEPDEPEPN